jgi:putative tricarboxylic transport membrane protein
MRRLAGAALAVLVCIAVTSDASAQAYPNHAITIIVPFPAGGPTDTTAREIANALQAKFKQNVVVENVTGGSTTIATNKVAHAAPDGYTLLLHNLAITANVTLFKNLPFNTEKDLTPIILVNKDPLVLVGRNSLAPKDLSELLALMKTQTLKAAIPGYGTTSHLATTLLAQQAKVSLDQIPYRGATPAVTDLLGGHVDLLIIAPQAIVPQVTAGKLKAYAITAKEKTAQLPTAESLAAALGPRFDIVYWQGLFAPAGTPPEALKIINEAVQEAVADPALVKKWADQGFDVFAKDQQSQSAAEAFFKSEVVRWGEVIRDNNIQVTP